MAENYNVWLKLFSYRQNFGGFCPCPWAMFLYKIMKSLNKNCLNNFHQISPKAFCPKDVDNLFKWFCAIEQDGCHARIWFKHLKSLSRTKKALRMNLGPQHQGLKVSLLSLFILWSRMTFDLFTIWLNLCPSCCGNTERSCMSFVDMQ